MQGTIAAARAHCANSRGDTQAAAEYARHALDLLPDCSSISQSIRSVSTLILGDASWINGNLEEAIRAYAEAIAHRPGSQERSHGGHRQLQSRGCFDRARSAASGRGYLYTRPWKWRSARMGSGRRWPGGSALSLGRLAYERNQLDEAEQYLHQCIDLCRQWEDFENQAVGYALLARLELARGHPETTQDMHASRSKLAGEHPLSTRRLIQMQSDLTRLWLAQGNLEKISQLIQKHGLKIEDEIPYQRAPEYVILLRSLLARNDHEAALVLSERLLKQAEPPGEWDWSLKS